MIKRTIDNEGCCKIIDALEQLEEAEIALQRDNSIPTACLALGKAIILLTQAIDAIEEENVIEKEE